MIETLPQRLRLEVLPHNPEVFFNQSGGQFGGIGCVQDCACRAFSRETRKINVLSVILWPQLVYCGFPSPVGAPIW